MNTTFVSFILCLALCANSGGVKAQPIDLTRFYIEPDQNSYTLLLDTRRNVATKAPPSSQGIGLHAFLRSAAYSSDYFRYYFLYAEQAGICDLVPRPTPLVSGVSVGRDTTALFGGLSCAEEVGTLEPTYLELKFVDRFQFDEPVRKTAVDGSQFDASPLIQTRNGEPWLTLFWGYRLGLLESQFDWDAQKLSTLPAFAKWPRFAAKDEEFVLLSLPPPRLEGTVTEHRNTENFPNAPGGVYFYASTVADRAVLDSGQPGKWTRTGKGFNHGGYVAVCRFYGSASPGPNSHFYTASDKECDVLKSLETKPRPTTKQQLNFEGKTFYANTPIPAKAVGQPPTCPVASIPLYRAYNAAYGPTGKRNYDGNHQFSVSRADIDEVVAKGWVDEGIVMCVPQ